MHSSQSLNYIVKRLVDSVEVHGLSSLFRFLVESLFLDLSLLVGLVSTVSAEEKEDATASNQDVQKRMGVRNLLVSFGNSHHKQGCSLAERMEWILDMLGCEATLLLTLSDQVDLWLDDLDFVRDVFIIEHNDDSSSDWFGYSDVCIWPHLIELLESLDEFWLEHCFATEGLAEIIDCFE